jgi:hypothetical protein
MPTNSAIAYHVGPERVCQVPFRPPNVATRKPFLGPMHGQAAARSRLVHRRRLKPSDEVTSQVPPTYATSDTGKLRIKDTYRKLKGLFEWRTMVKLAEMHHMRIRALPKVQAALCRNC